MDLIPSSSDATKTRVHTYYRPWDTNTSCPYVKLYRASIPVICPVSSPNALHRPHARHPFLQTHNTCNTSTARPRVHPHRWTPLWPLSKTKRHKNNENASKMSLNLLINYVSETAIYCLKYLLLLPSWQRRNRVQAVAPSAAPEVDTT